MKKVLKSRIFIVIITLVIGVSGTLYATTKYSANEISYNETTVEDALNELYDSQNISKIKEKGEYSKYIEYEKYEKITFNLENNYEESDNCYLIFLNKSTINGRFAFYVNIPGPIIGNSVSFNLINLGGASGNGGGTGKIEYGVVCIN